MYHIPGSRRANHESGRQVQARQDDVFAKVNPGVLGSSTGKTVGPTLGNEGGLPGGRSAEVGISGFSGIYEATEGRTKLGAQLEFCGSKASSELQEG